MWQKGLVLILTLCMTAAFTGTIGNTSTQSQDMGAAEMVLEGGSAGKVPFPHRRHQESLQEDCQVCHDMFPQQRGSIEALKAEDKLESKQVMNRLCTGCHRDYRRQGVKTGPISCSQCHER